MYGMNVLCWYGGSLGIYDWIPKSHRYEENCTRNLILSYRYESDSCNCFLPHFSANSFVMPEDISTLCFAKLSIWAKMTAPVVYLKPSALFISMNCFICKPYMLL